MPSKLKPLSITLLLAILAACGGDADSGSSKPKQIRYDTNADGNAERVLSYTYDANGNMLTQSHDGDDEAGYVDWSSTYTYDANGNQLTESFDYGADGNADSITTYTY